VVSLLDDLMIGGIEVDLDKPRARRVVAHVGPQGIAEGIAHEAAIHPRAVEDPVLFLWKSQQGYINAIKLAVPGFDAVGDLIESLGGIAANFDAREPCKTDWRAHGPVQTPCGIVGDMHPTWHLGLVHDAFAVGIE